MTKDWYFTIGFFFFFTTFSNKWKVGSNFLAIFACTNVQKNLMQLSKRNIQTSALSLWWICG